jgi:hypothetical protein
MRRFTRHGIDRGCAIVQSDPIRSDPIRSDPIAVRMGQRSAVEIGVDVSPSPYQTEIVPVRDQIRMPSIPTHRLE